MAHIRAKFGVLLPTLTSKFDLASSAAKFAEKYEEKWSKIEEMAEKAGRKSSEIEPAYFMDTCIGLDEKQTIKKAKLYVEAGHEKAFEEIKHQGAYGSPEAVVNQVERFLEAGVKHFVLVLVPQKHTLNSIQLCGENVLPQFT